MNRSSYLSTLLIILVFTTILCGISFGNIRVQTQPEPLPQTEMTVPPTIAVPTVTVDTLESVTLKQGDIKIITLSGDDMENLESWTSSNESVVSVDSGGRLDANSVGTVEITAQLKGNRLLKCKVTVTEADKAEYVDTSSTCISANYDILEANLNRGSYQNPYYIKVNRQENCVTVYTYDEDGEYTVPIRAMVSSCGKEGYDTITGEYNLYFKNEWNGLFGDSEGHYVSGISGDFLFHSVPYHSASADDLKTEEFNKLGQDGSLGCVRLASADVQWIYDNCIVGTPIEIYDDDNPGPLGKPDTIKISDHTCGWDPTDTADENPYKNKKPQIVGAKDITIKRGDSFSPLEGVKALDTCSNDITNKMTVTGNVVTTNRGTYKVTYAVTDALHRSAKVDINVTIE